jgi:hypothetical protein
MGNGATYANRDSGRLMVDAGSYTARFVYVNAPGFPNAYSPRDIPTSGKDASSPSLLPSLWRPERNPRRTR